MTISDSASGIALRSVVLIVASAMLWPGSGNGAMARDNTQEGTPHSHESGTVEDAPEDTPHSHETGTLEETLRRTRPTVTLVPWRTLQRTHHIVTQVPCTSHTP